MKVIFANETYYCTRAVRTANNATLYLAPTEERPDGGKIEFIGVNDWSAFAIEGGKWEAPEPTREDQIEAQAMYTALMTDTLLEEE